MSVHSDSTCVETKRMESLTLATHLLRTVIAPVAQALDHDVDALGRALEVLCRNNLMALKRPTEFGGPDLPNADFRKFQEEVARTSGALAFLQTQHQSAVSMIAHSDNEALKEEYLPKMANGERLVGIGFSQLRRSGPPIMKATPTEGGYVLEGLVPWVTGWSFFPEFLIGAALPDGRALFAMVPLRDVPNSVKVSEPMRLAAMEAARTVSVEFTAYELPEERVAFIKPEGWIQNNDMINIALQGSFAMGCARAGLDIMAENGRKRKLTTVLDLHRELSTELSCCRARFEELRDNTSDATLEKRLDLRAWQIELAARCAHAAVTSSGGAANSVDHPAQRVYREALVYTVSAQTVPIMEATLRRLAHRGASSG